MVQLTEKNIKGLSYKDVVVLMFIEQYRSKTARELSLIIGCDYSSLTETLTKLIIEDRIIKIKTYPYTYDLK